ncbi:MAG: rhomboid family intramembrane serine protease [Bacteroidetes bacterium]|nr:rhomboid family intramembrane serine protease [Bacteroidota bacterium]
MITYIIIGITTLISISAFSNRDLFGKLLFNASAVYNHRQWYRLFSHGLVHADAGHLLLNMFVLFSFGTAIENHYFKAIFSQNASFVFALMYVTALPASTLYSYYKHKHNYAYNAVGASGAVSAVVFACILISPLSTLLVWFIPVKAFIFGALYLAYSWYMGKKGTDNVGHDAHFWGAVYGIVFTAVLKPGLIMNFIYQLQSVF